MKKYTVTLFLFVFMTSSSHALLATEVLAGASSKPATESASQPKPTSQAAPRLQLDDSLYSDDEYALIAAVPATQKPAWKRHYEYVGARILSAFLAIHKYATESYGSFKKFIMYKIMRRKLEIERAENKQQNSGVRPEEAGVITK